MVSNKKIDYDLLQVLICIIEEGTFTAAADRLNVTQQAISAQVKRLENLAQRQLLERTAHGIVLTRDGEVMLTYARQIATISDRMRKQFSAVPLADKIRVGFAPNFPSCALAIVLGHVKDVAPNIEISVETGRTDALINKFNAARLDVVLGIQRPGNAKGEVLLRDKIQWVGRESTTPDPTKPVSLVAFPAPGILRDVMLESLSRVNQTWSVAMESEDLGTIFAGIISGWGFSAMNDLLIRKAPAGIIAIESSFLPDMGDIEFFLRYDDRNRPASRIFVDALRAVTIRGQLGPGFTWHSQKMTVAKHASL
jgi:DNA-binding transcriptional LysR family regulator